MEKSILKIIEKYNLKDDLEHLLDIENPENDPDAPPGYKGKEDFVYNSLKYVPKIIKEIKQKTGIEIGFPTICPCHDKSIDFYWKTNDYSLLVNIPENSSVVYYMINSKHEKIAEGELM